MTEQAIQKKIITYIEKTLNGYVANISVASKSGTPDLLACIDGAFYGIEVKKPTTMHTVSKLQEHHLNLIRKSGGKAYAVSSVEQLEQYINPQVVEV